MENINSIRARLTEEQEKLEKINESLEQLETTNSKKLKEFLSVKLDLERTIKANTEILANNEGKLHDFFSSFKLDQTVTGRKCNVYQESTKTWVPGEILRVLSEQTAEVILLGHDQKRLFPASYIQLLLPPNKSDLYETQLVQVLLHDGKWYDASIKNFNDTAITVYVNKWNHIHTAAYECVRIVENTAKRSLTERDFFEIPENLKILPNDSKETRLRKRKKVKNLKKAWKQQQTEKETQKYVSSWKNFQKKTQKKAVPRTVPEP